MSLQMGHRQTQVTDLLLMSSRACIGKRVREDAPLDGLLLLPLQIVSG